MNYLYLLIYKDLFLFLKIFFLLNLSVSGLVAFGGEDQIRLNQTQYPGVVRIIIPGRVNATGFFIAPDIIVTDFHVVERFKRSIHKSGFFFANSEIGFVARQDVKIRSLDSLYDLAALKIEGYQSKFFYPVDPSFDFEKDIKTSKQFTAAGFPNSSFRIEHGSFVDSHSFGDKAFVRIGNEKWQESLWNEWRSGFF